MTPLKIKSNRMDAHQVKFVNFKKTEYFFYYFQVKYKNQNHFKGVNFTDFAHFLVL